MGNKNKSSFIQWVIKTKILGILFFIVIGLFVILKISQAVIDNPTLFVQQVLNGLQLGFVYALIALGYTMIYGILRLINFAHGDVFMIGSFTSYYGITRFNMHLWFQNLFPSAPALLSQLIGSATVILLSMTVCALLAFVIERVAYKPLRHAPRISPLITAIGVSFFLEYFGSLKFVFTANYITFKRPFDIETWFISPSGFGMLEKGSAPPDGSILFSNIFVIIVIVSLLLLLLLQYFVQRTKTGKAMRAVAYDKETAQLMGINVNGIISTTFAIGSSLAGAAGMLYAIAFPQVYFFMGITPGLKAFIAAVLGGIGSIPGAFIGALIMGQAEVLSAAYISTPMRDAIAFSILIIVLLIRPKGILGEISTEKV
ncbi:MAG: branched-chain amino acid ABC transporter permease [Anaerolineaceae bacterium]|nr:branched-chain amino acid ABC transporter permease [Anaerolineaceae bacterium]